MLLLFIYLYRLLLVVKRETETLYYLVEICFQKHVLKIGESKSLLSFSVCVDTATDPSPGRRLQLPVLWRHRSGFVKHFEDGHCVTVLSVRLRGPFLIPSPQCWVLFGIVVGLWTAWFRWSYIPDWLSPLNKDHIPPDFFFNLLHLCSNVIVFYACFLY